MTSLLKIKTRTAISSGGHDGIILKEAICRLRRSLSANKLSSNTGNARRESRGRERQAIGARWQTEGEGSAAIARRAKNASLDAPDRDALTGMT
jgi:hypothetical protein